MADAADAADEDPIWSTALGGSAHSRRVARGGDKKPAKPHADSAIRLEIIKGVKSQIDTVAARRSKSKQTGNRLLLPLFTTVASLVTCLEETAANLASDLAAEAEATLGLITPLLSKDPLTTLLILIEPYKVPNRHPMISDEFLTHWQESEDDTTNKTCIEAYTKILTKYSVANPAAVEAAVETIRGEVDKLFVKVKKAAEKEAAIGDVFSFIRGSYEKLATGGVIARQRLYSPTLCKQLTADRLIWMGHMRFWVGMSLNRSGYRSAPRLRELIDNISDAMPGNDYARELLPFMTLDAFSVSVMPPLLELNKWVNSTAFFYYLAARDAPPGAAARGSIDPRDAALLDVDGALLDEFTQPPAAEDGARAAEDGSRARSRSRGRSKTDSQ
jgi:hypothetical protein